MTPAADCAGAGVALCNAYNVKTKSRCLIKHKTASMVVCTVCEKSYGFRCIPGCQFLENSTAVISPFVVAAAAAAAAVVVVVVVVVVAAVVTILPIARAVKIALPLPRCKKYWPNLVILSTVRHIQIKQF